MALSPAAIADAAPDLILVLDARDLRVSFSTRRAAALGYSADELIGLRLEALMPGASPELFERARTGRHDPHPDVPLRVSIKHKDGHLLPVDVRVARLRDDDAASPLVASLRLLSERARAAERELVSALGAVPAAIVTWKLDGTIMSWNPAAHRLFGHAPDDAIGQHIHLMVPWADRSEFDTAAQKLLERDGHFAQHEVLRTRVDGEIRVEESLFVIRDVAWQPVRIGGHFRDVAELMRLRRATEVLNRSSGNALGVGDDALQPLARLGEQTAPLVRALEDAARQDRATVLLTGEMGTGKGSLARFIHESSARRSGPFLEVNCAGLDPALCESELFGHERGAFTGADSQRMGILEAADGGTLLLDELSELPHAAQAKLLSFLDDGAFRRVGGVKRITANVRVVWTSQTELAALVEQGRLRRDLAFRLNALAFSVPPLRERREDIAVLARAVLDDLQRSRPRAPRAVSDDATAALMRHDWPGNLRELRSVIERALSVAPDAPLLEARHLALGPGQALVQNAPARRRRSKRLEDVVQEHIEQVVRETQGNLVRASAILGIDRSTLRRKLRAGADAAGVS